MYFNIHNNDHRGVKLPIFTEIETGKDQMENIGLAGGGGKIQNCREKFRSLLRDLIRLASLQVRHHNPGTSCPKQTDHHY